MIDTFNEKKYILDKLIYYSQNKLNEAETSEFKIFIEPLFNFFFEGSKEILETYEIDLGTNIFLYKLLVDMDFLKIPFGTNQSIDSLNPHISPFYPIQKYLII